MTEETASDQLQILVADDDLAILRLVKAIAEKEGYAVVTARDGREAYKILQDEDNFAVAVIDVVMPYIQGTELARHMQTENRLKKIPIIMMTAEQNPRLSSESFAAGAVVFLPKPFTTSQLQVMLRMLTGGARAQG
jgi:chemosensory pili system protein ChpA (sensor histidine kinase/response regulator)